MKGQPKRTLNIKVSTPHAPPHMQKYKYTPHTEGEKKQNKNCAISTQWNTYLKGWMELLKRQHQRYISKIIILGEKKPARGYVSYNYIYMKCSKSQNDRKQIKFFLG